MLLQEFGIFQRVLLSEARAKNAPKPHFSLIYYAQKLLAKKVFGEDVAVNGSWVYRFPFFLIFSRSQQYWRPCLYTFFEIKLTSTLLDLMCSCLVQANASYLTNTETLS